MKPPALLFFLYLMSNLCPAQDGYGNRSAWPDTILFNKNYQIKWALAGNYLQRALDSNGYVPAEKDDDLNYTISQMNYWFSTTLFNSLQAAVEISVMPSNDQEGDFISISELIFSSPEEALKAVQCMDAYGLNNVLFFPPVHFFWIPFHDRIYFIYSYQYAPYNHEFLKAQDQLLKLLFFARRYGKADEAGLIRWLKQ
jgi:hypothetical protein